MAVTNAISGEKDAKPTVKLRRDAVYDEKEAVDS